MLAQVADFLFLSGKKFFDSLLTDWGIIGFGIISMFVFPRVVNFIFQSTSPRGGTTAKTAKIYSIYHNIFSHSYNKTKSIPQISNPTPQSHHKTPQNSGADPPAFLCSLPIRTT